MKIDTFGLTHWGRDEMESSQMTFSNVFSSMKMFEFRLKCHWRLFPRVQFTIFQPWFRWWLGAVQATSHYLNQWWILYRRIYASLGLNELTLKRPAEASEAQVPIQNYLHASIFIISAHCFWYSSKICFKHSPVILRIRCEKSAL